MAGVMTASFCVWSGHSLVSSDELATTIENYCLNLIQVDVFGPAYECLTSSLINQAAEHLVPSMCQPVQRAVHYFSSGDMDSRVHGSSAQWAQQAWFL